VDAPDAPPQEVVDVPVEVGVGRWHAATIGP
jgi:hypothetical protein